MIPDWVAIPNKNEWHLFVMMFMVFVAIGFSPVGDDVLKELWYVVGGAFFGLLLSRGVIMLL
jgi:hypothetical protein